MLSAQPCYPHNNKAPTTSCLLLFLLSELTAAGAALRQARQWHAVCAAALALLRNRRQLVARLGRSGGLRTPSATSCRSSFDVGAVYRADLTGPNLTQQRACGSAVTVSDGAYGQLVAAFICLLAGCSAAIVTLSASSDLQPVANFTLRGRRLWLPSTPARPRARDCRHVETKGRSRHSGLSYTPVNHPLPTPV